MNPRLSKLALLLLLVVIAAFVGLTAAALPEVVASHFGAGGAADGFMPRGTYIVVLLVLVLVLGVPLLLSLLPAAVAGHGKNLNIPHQAYRLAPERRDSTVAFIRVHGTWFAAAVALFMAYVHWRVLQANLLQPPRLSTTAITAGLVLFFALLAIWLAILYARFRRPH